MLICTWRAVTDALCGRGAVCWCDEPSPLGAVRLLCRWFRTSGLLGWSVRMKTLEFGVRTFWFKFWLPYLRARWPGQIMYTSQSPVPPPQKREKSTILFPPSVGAGVRGNNGRVVISLPGTALSTQQELQHCPSLVSSLPYPAVAPPQHLNLLLSMEELTTSGQWIIRICIWNHKLKD